MMHLKEYIKAKNVKHWLYLLYTFIIMYNYVYVSLKWDLYIGDIHLKGISTVYLSVR